ncbi:MAG: Unknown protein [uncultured Thiotrichaceae bacterium]|uniref:Salt-induced outer membrane protein n=1 Tax=uncultured Thiotrichaceae bacterium TaxID=298394 RepID=A0A6S6U9L7_9GAMM|nr:MAG: Unknown protein [uncultured Thiotrichaceae bacterium]
MIIHTNKTILSTSSLFLALLTLTTAALAEDQQPPSGGDFLSADEQGSASTKKLFGNEADLKSKEGWSGQASAGLVTSTGNAENNNITAGINATYMKRRWRHTFAGNVYFAESEGERTAEHYALSHKARYSLSQKSYLFNFISYDADEFADIDFRIADVLGYGHTLIDTDKHYLEAELGLGFRQTQFISDDPDSDETVGNLGLHYIGKLTDTTKLTEDLLILGGDENVFTESVTALNVKMTEKLSLSLNYTIRNNSDVPDGIEKTDTITSVNLVADF